jgi:ActR/RegA family two-component response regulator
VRSETERRSLLIVDDDHTFRSRLARALRHRGFEATCGCLVLPVSRS